MMMPNRKNLILKGGILGRTDDMTIVRGVNVYPSIFELDDNVATKKFSIGARQDFNRGISLDLRFFYEFSDYQPTKSGSLRSRTEDLKSFRVSLGKEMNINYFEDSQVSIFYNHLTNDSTKDYYDFEKDQFGLQFRFSL